ncbi:hypothetical protein [Mesorhizobium sp.]|uniref:hypothetical protein n=1 Tax=Mesorhizobium sp. TaxID=1871066 RepID=UPI000FE3C749|nr:hypothetical protein [Mesorhizobium sp.]RWN50284.1 MAG: hypothetical protein EOR98_32530 [Mesorhizobium sp.]RWN70688.1 MAG: hypothetical protein EOS02_33100 [Mesorhizobium sp.]RWN71316.1 MAG: hypothetical protein EOS01_31330 [Mesorhizobium sp.]RWN82297.1 MAG: hypothetical protein EOS04_32090 [Mesorhizobium sp.]RWO06745.1 MAG: hypothetical protein EOS15_32660 [Mesorhizobium sp.]
MHALVHAADVRTARSVNSDSDPVRALSLPAQAPEGPKKVVTQVNVEIVKRSEQANGFIALRLLIRKVSFMKFPDRI